MLLSLRPVLAALALSAAACSGAPPVPADARTLIVSLTRIDCADCGDRIVADLRRRPGVYDASFDKRSAEIRVTASPSFDVYTAVRQLAAEDGFDAILGAGKGQYLPSPTYPAGSDVVLVTKDGADVPDLSTVIVKGKVTIVDFTAAWCRPCRELDAHILKVLGARRDIAYRRLDVGDWDTPLAKHYLHNIPQLPYVIVYGVDGIKVKGFAGVDLAGLDAAIARAAPAAPAVTAPLIAPPTQP